MTELTTKELRNNTHQALRKGQWGTARKLLDDLGARKDNKEYLCTALEYGEVAPNGLPDYMEEVIQDRIDLVNTWAEMNNIQQVG